MHHIVGAKLPQLHTTAVNVGRNSGHHNQQLRLTTHVSCCWVWRKFRRRRHARLMELMMLLEGITQARLLRGRREMVRRQMKPTCSRKRFNVVHLMRLLSQVLGRSGGQDLRQTWLVVRVGKKSKILNDITNGC